MVRIGWACLGACAVLWAAGSPVTADDASTPPSYRHEVIPLLTRFGCNQGACHGKLAGQNGFKLSLRGYAPEQDYEHLVLEGRGRRIVHAAPEAGLLLAKPTNRVPHKGGKLFDEGSQPYKLLERWVRAGTPGLVAEEPSLSHIQVVANQQTLKVGQTQPLQVIAHFADGAARDVTWLAQFFTNDHSVIGVSADGLVHAKREGATVVRVHFQDRVEAIDFTIPHQRHVDPSLFAERYNDVDRHVYALLQTLRIPPSPVCDDRTFVRRVFLDTIGTLPTPEEVDAFTADTSTDKRVRLVDELLRRPEFVDFWTLQLGDLLQNRKERDHDVRSAKGVRNFHGWLREQVAANRPWGQLAREVLTSSGDVNIHPAVGYYIVTVGEHREAHKSEVVDSVAQSFLGVRIGCAKCHNHPDEKFTQDDYYHFAAFFSRLSLDREKPDKGTTLLKVMSHEEHQQRDRMVKLEQQIAEHEAELAGKQGDEADKLRNEIDKKRKQIEDAQRRIDDIAKRPVQVTQPRTGQPIPPQPLDRRPVKVAPGDDPRAALAKWVTDPSNAYFSGAMVNRVWKHFMGVGLVEPVDDLRPSNPPTNAALWRHLNEQFVASGYDLRALMRTILTSRVYQHGSATLPENVDDRRFYSHSYARRLSAEVLLDAIAHVTGEPDEFRGYPVGVRAIALPDPDVDSYFLSTFGRSDRVTACACEREGEVTLPQVLHLQNGDAVLGKIRSGDGRLAEMLKQTSDHEQVAERLFVTTLARMPTDDERRTINALLAEEGVDKAEVLRDVFWALLNSKEFVFNH